MAVSWIENGNSRRTRREREESMIVKFFLAKDQLAETKIDSPPRVDEYVTVYTRGRTGDYKVISTRHIYSDPTPGTYSMMMAIVHLRSLTIEEEEHVKLSRPE